MVNQSIYLIEFDWTGRRAREPRDEWPLNLGDPPQPQTPNPKPQTPTLNPKPQTLKPNPDALRGISISMIFWTFFLFFLITLELSWGIQRSMSLKYEPSWEPLHDYVKQLFLNRAPSAINTEYSTKHQTLNKKALKATP